MLNLERIAALLFVSLLLGVVLFSTPSFAQTSGPQCSIQGVSQSRSISPADKSSVYFDRISLNFQEIERTQIAPNYFIGLPELVVEVNWQSFIGVLAQELQNDFRRAAERNDIDFSGSGFSNVSLSSNEIVIRGWARFEKWAKWDWVCCKWFKCRKCEAKTRLFRKTVDFVITIDKQDILKADQGINFDFDTRRVVKQKAASVHVFEDVSFGSSGHALGSPNLLEQIVDILTGTVEAITQLWGDDQFQFSEIYSSSTAKEPTFLQSTELLRSTEYNYAYDPDVTEETEQPGHLHRGFWQAFFSSLYLDASESGFFGSSSAPKFRVTYSFNIDQYYEFLAKDGVNDGLQTDVLFDAVLCGRGKEVFAQYLDFVRDKYTGKAPPQQSIAVGEEDTSTSILAKIDEAYGLGGVSEYFLPNLERYSPPGNYALPSLDTIMATPGVSPIEANLWAFAAEEDWNSAERACAEKIARDRSGNPSLIFPFQSFESCLEETEERVQQDILDDAYERYGDELFLEKSATRLVTPVSGGAKYRGWYYCYRNKKLCTGKQIIMWYDDASKYKARGGRHGGVDLIDLAQGGETRIQAVATGRLIYNNRDLSGWGHALLLPFRKGGKSYFAVYAHLNPNVSSLDGKRVQAGDFIALSACTGNAGDGKGNCNDYCHVNGAYRTDNHLHFAVLERNGSKTKNVDPLAVVGFTVQEDRDKNLYRCKEPEKLVSVGE